MRKTYRLGTMVVLGLVAAGTSALLARAALAHCDSTNGPVIPEAKAALESGDIHPILKWVTEENEAKLTTAFAKAVAVRAKGPEAKEIADRYFLETLVRLHRAGEGAPYTGINDEPVEPIVAMADNALLDGSPDDMIKAIGDHMAEAIQQRFNKVIETSANKDTSVEAGREFVEAYVTYVHYVEGIHTAIMSATPHHAQDATSAAQHTE